MNAVLEDVAQMTEETPGAVASDCLEQSNGDPKKASQLMRERLDSSDNLRDAVTRPLIDGAIWTLITKAMRQTRSNYFKQTNNERQGLAVVRTGGTKGIEAVSARNWYDYPLAGGLKLGDATKNDVNEQITIHLREVETNRQRAEFFKRIVDRIPDGKKVREVLTNDQIQEMA